MGVVQIVFDLVASFLYLAGCSAGGKVLFEYGVCRGVSFELAELHSPISVLSGGHDIIHQEHAF